MASCGSSDNGASGDVPTGTEPVIASITPASGPVGSTILIEGFGFSLVPQNNIIIIGNSSVAATDYQLVIPAVSPNIEELTATVPTGSAVGVNSVTVVVDGNPSNSDITFTVTP